MSLIQRLFQAILPRQMAESMEADSRDWKLRCPNCGHERSFWEIGGIRWKAVGNPRNLLRCPNCGQLTWHRAYKSSDQPAQASTTE